jgi:ABC-type Zn uptake system ZnuABC Zn-binding protein ZnuA
VIRRPLALSLLFVLVAAAVIGAACRGRTAGEKHVAATVFPLYDLARRVAGDRIVVDLVLPPGADPHGYEPRPKDVAALADASLVFAVGLGLDPWAQGMARAAGAGEARVFELGPLMDPILAPPGVVRSEPFIDAHFWTDPVRALRTVDVIVDALSGLDPAGAPFYRERGQALKRSIETVHADVSRRAAAWIRRRIVTFHGSLFYFAERYRIQVVGVVETVPGAEPTAQHVQSLVAILSGPDPAALFVEPQMDPQLARSIAREAGVGFHEIDAMGGGEATASYEALLQEIAHALDEALR